MLVYIDSTCSIIKFACAYALCAYLLLVLLIKHHIFCYHSNAPGPEPTYSTKVTGYDVYHHKEPFPLKYRDGMLPSVDVAYETWGTLNENKDNAVIIHAGLSASSHAKSNKVRFTEILA